MKKAIRTIVSLALVTAFVFSLAISTNAAIMIDERSYLEELEEILYIPQITEFFENLSFDFYVDGNFFDGIVNFVLSIIDPIIVFFSTHVFGIFF